MGAAPATRSSGRLDSAARRASLLDAAAQLVAEGAVDDVSVESVAERAGVSRPLVYKHFANREEILAELYRRESELLHRELAREVGAAGSLEEMFEALVRSAVRASRERGPLFAALRNAGAWSREVGREQRDRDNDTARAFTRRAVSELGADARAAAPLIGLLLGMIDHVLAQDRAKPTPAVSERLIAAYLTIVRSSLAALARPSGRREAK